MKSINYLYPHWGSVNYSAREFTDLAIDLGFQGIEMNLPDDEQFQKEFLQALNQTRKHNPNFICVLQQVLPIKSETAEEYISEVMRHLEGMLPYQPDFINSHTGKDYFSFDENCRVLNAIESFSEKHSIPIYHEIHRGRFTFHSATTLSYLEKYPNLKLVGDLSHWCVTSESMLQDQAHILDRIIPHIKHIHARVGFEQSPQVNNPFANEWESYLEQFVVWWQDIINVHHQLNDFTITPEFGPYPYMPQAPFTQQPLADQKELNVRMKSHLENQLVVP